MQHSLPVRGVLAVASACTSDGMEKIGSACMLAGSLLQGFSSCMRLWDLSRSFVPRFARILYRSMEFLTSSQRDFLQQLEPPSEPGRSEMILSRRNLWHHDANHPLRPQERVRLLLSSAAEDFCEWIENSVQEPEAVAWNYLLWQSHEKAAVEDDASSVAPSLSGDLFQERERLATYLALTPERKAALCGWDSSHTAITRAAGFVPPPEASPEAPSSWQKRLREVEQGLTALRRRVDVVEECTGTVIGEGSRDCHAFRLRRLEASCGLGP